MKLYDKLFLNYRNLSHGSWHGYSLFLSRINITLHGQNGLKYVGQNVPNCWIKGKVKIECRVKAIVAILNLMFWYIWYQNWNSYSVV